MGQKGSQRAHQAHYRSGHPVVGAGNHRHQCEHNLHHLSGRSEENARHQAPVSSDDHQEPEEIFHIRSAGPGR